MHKKYREPVSHKSYDSFLPRSIEWLQNGCRGLYPFLPIWCVVIVSGKCVYGGKYTHARVLVFVLGEVLRASWLGDGNWPPTHCAGTYSVNSCY